MDLALLKLISVRMRAFTFVYDRLHFLIPQNFLGVTFDFHVNYTLIHVNVTVANLICRALKLFLKFVERPMCNRQVVALVNVTLPAKKLSSQTVDHTPRRDFVSVIAKGC